MSRHQIWGETTRGETTRGEVVLGRIDLLPSRGPVPDSETVPYYNGKRIANEIQ